MLRHVAPCILILAVTAQAHADVVHLANGRTVRGRILEEGKKEILLAVPNGRLTVPAIDVVRIERETEFDYCIAQGGDLLEQASFTAAADHFGEALRIRPDSVKARQGLAAAMKGEGDLFLEKRRLREAVAAYEKAIETDPEQEGATEKLDHVRKVIALADELQGRSKALTGKGEAGEAARLLRRVLGIDPSRWSEVAPEMGDLLRKAGDRLYREGKHAQAALAYDRALRADPNLVGALMEARIWCHLQEVEALIEEEKLAEARDVAEGLQFEAPYHRRVAYALAEIDQGEGKLVAARDAYLRILGENRAPDDPTDLGRLRRRALEAIGPPPVPGEATEPRAVAKEWGVLEIGSIRIHHKQPDLARDVALSLEHYLNVLPGHLGPLPRPNPLQFDVWIHPDRDSYSAAGGRGRSALEIESRAGLVEKTIRLDASDPQAVACYLPREVGRLLQLGFQSYRPVHPPWVSEGLAARCEPVYKRLYYLDLAADDFRRGEPNPIRRLMMGAKPAGTADRARAYAVVEYLIDQRGLNHFNIAIDDLIRFPIERFLATRYGVETRFGIDPIDQLSGHLGDWLQATTREEEE